MLEGGGIGLSVTLLIAYAMSSASGRRHAACRFGVRPVGAMFAVEPLKGVPGMSFLDKAKDFLDKHDDQVDKALDKVGEQVNKRTDGKYTSQVDRAVDEAQRRTGAGDTQP
jgi:hypothetical protein